MKRGMGFGMFAVILVVFAGIWFTANPAYCVDLKPLPKPIIGPSFAPEVRIHVNCFCNPSDDAMPVKDARITLSDQSSPNRTSFNMNYNFKVVVSYFDLSLQQTVTKEIPRSAFQWTTGDLRYLVWSSPIMFLAKKSVGVKAEAVYVATPGDPPLPPVAPEVAAKRVSVDTTCIHLQ